MCFFLNSERDIPAILILDYVLSSSFIINYGTIIYERHVHLLVSLRGALTSPLTSTPPVGSHLSCESSLKVESETWILPGVPECSAPAMSGTVHKAFHYTNINAAFNHIAASCVHARSKHDNSYLSHLCFPSCLLCSLYHLQAFSWNEWTS